MTTATTTTDNTVRTCATCSGHGITFGPVQAPRNPSDKPKPEPRFCLCTCGLETSPKSSYRPGHDARVKGYVARALAWAGGDEKERAEIKGIAQIPQILVDRLNAEPTFKVADYDAGVILWAAGETGTF